MNTEKLLRDGKLGDKFDDVLSIIQHSGILDENSGAAETYAHFIAHKTERKEQLQSKYAIPYKATRNRYEAQKRIKNLKKIVERIEQGEKACVPYLTDLLSGLIIKDFITLNYNDVIAVIEKTIRIFLRVLTVESSNSNDDETSIYKECFKALRNELLLDFNITLTAHISKWRTEYIKEVKEYLNNADENAT